VAAYFAAAAVTVGRLDPGPVPVPPAPSGGSAGVPLWRHIVRLVVPPMFLGPVLLTSFLVVQFDATPWQIGLLLGAKTAGALVGAVVVASFTIAPRRLFRWGLILGGSGTLCVVVAALTPPTWLGAVLAGGFVIAFADSFIMVGVIEEATSVLSGADQGRFFLWQDAILTGSAQLGSLVLGVVLTLEAGTAGYLAYLVLSGVAALTVGVGTRMGAR
jgi:hypothetical protein